MSMEPQSISVDALIARLENLPAEPRSIPSADRMRALAWLALAPAWPVDLAVRGFPSGIQGGIETGDPVNDFGRRLEAENLILVGPGEPPLEGPWWRMEQGQRNTTIRDLLAGPQAGVPFLLQELQAAALQMEAAAQSAGVQVNAPLARWILLARQTSLWAMADVLDDNVDSAIAAAGGNELYASEADDWVKTAQPLAEIFGSELEVAFARAQRQMDLFRRAARDQRYLANYYPRPDLEDAFDSMLKPEADDSWALHYVGVGGIGKTMLIRRIRAQKAREADLAVGHVDFDHLNPDYPRRAPGLLLMGFVEDLQLAANSDAVRIFREFRYLIRSVHEKLQSTFVAGAQGYAREGFAQARAFFVEGLKQIWVSGQRPILILDTCEELARIRSDGELPENVKFTFDLLESIQADVKALRVVFSGRRPLACEGTDWTWPGSRLPKRPYLRLQEVLPFTELQAEGMLGAFTNRTNNLTVPASIFEEIKNLSSVDRDKTGEAPASLTRAKPKIPAPGVPARVSPDPGGKYYYPYDLDLYATWITADPSFDRAKLSGGKHVYVKDRIVNRLQYELRPWLAHLTILGWFDRSMMARLTGNTGREAAGLWDLLVQQEWTEPYQDAQREEVWAVLPRIRTRLLMYYLDEDPDTFRAARKVIAELLRKLTLDRPFAELTPEYFESCLEVSVDEPLVAAAWWDAVEQKLAAAERWDWGRGLTDLLLHDDSIAGHASGGGSSSAQESPLRPAILATYAAVNLHGTGDDRERNAKQHVWEEVLEKCDRHPDPAGQERLRWRAQNALAGTANRDDIRQMVDLLDTKRPDSSGEVARNPQMFASLLARLERLVENLESSDLSRFGPLQKSAWIVPPEYPDQLRAFSAALDGRLALLIDPRNTLAALDTLRWASGLAGGADNRQCWLDWRAPDNLRERLQLEMARWEKPALPSSFSPTVDGDRLAAAAMHWELDQKVTEALIPGFDAPGEYAICEPLCNAHRAFPPYAAVAVEAMGAQGNLDAAARLAGKILSDSKYPLAFREAVDRAQLDLVNRYRLYEERIGLESSLRDSPLPEDIRALRILRLLRTGGVNTAVQNFDKEKRNLKNELDTSPITASRVPGVRAVQLASLVKERPRRIAASLFLRGLIRLQDERQNALRRFTEAHTIYRAANDPVGRLICAIAIAMVRADSRSKDDLISQLESISHIHYPAASALAYRLIPAYTAGADEWIAYIEHGQRTWRPWMVRLAACAIRAQEFQNPGEQSGKLLNWVSAHYPTDTAAAMIRPLAGRTKPPRISLDTVIQVAAVVAAVAFVYGIYWAYTAVLGLAHVHMSAFRNVVSLIALAGGGSIVARYLPKAFQWYVGLLRFVVTVTRRVEPVTGLTNPSDPLTVPRRLQERWLAFRVYANRTQRTTGTVAMTEPYVKQSAILSERLTSYSPFRAIPAGSTLDNTILVDGSSAAAPWEAIFALAGGNLHTFDEVRYRFRRQLDGRPFVVTTPFSPSIRAVTWSWDPSASRFAPAVWSSAKQGEPHELESPNVTGTMRIDSGIGIMHVVAKPVESSSGVVLRLYGSDEIQPAQLILFAPSVRVCILQDIPEEHTDRTLTDRYTANVARRFGFQLHNAGVPAVVVIPPLREPLAASVLQIFADTLMKFPENGGYDLWAAVQAARIKIAAEAHTDREIATEIAFDLCYYAPQRLNLSRTSGGQ